MAGGSSYNNISAEGNVRQHNGNVYNTNTNNYTTQQSQGAAHPFASLLASAGASTALHKACSKGNEALVCTLLDSGMDSSIEAKDQDWMTPLQVAVYKNRINVVRVLLSSGANTEAQCRWWGASQLPIFLAVSAGNGEMVRLLLEHGADIEEMNLRRLTPLCLAAKDGLESVVPILLDKGADLEAKDADGMTALWWATKFGHERVITMLLQRGASVEARLRTGKSIDSLFRNRPQIAQLFKQGQP